MVMSIYGLDVSLPVNCIFNAPEILGAINNKDDIYWLLVEESIIKFLLINSDGLMRRGG